MGYSNIVDFLIKMNPDFIAYLRKPAHEATHFKVAFEYKQFSVQRVLARHIYNQCAKMTHYVLLKMNEYVTYYKNHKNCFFAKSPKLDLLHRSLIKIHAAYNEEQFQAIIQMLKTMTDTYNLLILSSSRIDNFLKNLIEEVVFWLFGESQFSMRDGKKVNQFIIEKKDKRIVLEIPDDFLRLLREEELATKQLQRKSVGRGYKM